MMVRNLRQHPIEAREAEETLRKLADQLEAENLVGDLRPLILRNTATIISRLGFVWYNTEIKP